MAGRRGSATVAAVVLCLLLVALHCQAATYVVGDSAGWSKNLSAWTRGKSFKAGDFLMFNYKPGAHNVARVNKGGYDGCYSPPNAIVYTSGKDQIRLVKGLNNFICTLPGHCVGGMKLEIST